MTLAEIATKALAGIGGDFVDPPVLIEAKVPLELSGEAVRSRICTFVDQNGREWALRPDLTLVVAQSEVDARSSDKTGETIRRYSGPVFRLPRRQAPHRVTLQPWQQQCRPDFLRFPRILLPRLPECPFRTTSTSRLRSGRRIPVPAAAPRSVDRK